MQHRILTCLVGVLCYLPTMRRTGYTLERCGQDNEWTVVAKALDGTEFVDQGLRPLTTVRYRVR